MPASRIAALGLTLLLAGGLVACGGDEDGGGGGEDAGGSSETVSAEAYAADVCGAMQDWIAGIEERAQDIGSGLDGTDADAGKQALADLLSEMSNSTGDLVSAVEDAGVPDVEGGEDAADSLVTAFEEVQQILEDAQADVEELPSDVQGFQQGAAELGPTIQEALTSVGESLEDPASEDLKNAFQEEEACSAVP